MMTSHAQDLHHDAQDQRSNDSDSEETPYIDASTPLHSSSQRANHSISEQTTSCADANTQLHPFSQQNEGVHSAAGTGTEKQRRSTDPGREMSTELEHAAPQNTGCDDLKEEYDAYADKKDTDLRCAHRNLRVCDAVNKDADLKFPEVPQHAHTWDGVEAKTSLIPGAGMGLFATRPFHCGEVVCVYGTQDGSVLCTRDAIRLQVCDIHVDTVFI
jgi:hypothetical protein